MCLLQCGHNDLLLFVSEEPALTRVRIEGRDGNPRLRQAKILLQGAMGDTNGGYDFIRGEQAEDSSHQGISRGGGRAAMPIMYPQTPA